MDVYKYFKFSLEIFIMQPISSLYIPLLLRLIYTHILMCKNRANLILNQKPPC